MNRLPVLSRNVSQLIEILPGALRSTSPVFIGENPGSDTNGFVNGKGSGITIISWMESKARKPFRVWPW